MGKRKTLTAVCHDLWNISTLTVSPLFQHISQQLHTETEEPFGLDRMGCGRRLDLFLWNSGMWNGERNIGEKTRRPLWLYHHWKQPGYPKLMKWTSWWNQASCRVPSSLTSIYGCHWLCFFSVRQNFSSGLLINRSATVSEQDVKRQLGHGGNSDQLCIKWIL